VVTVPIRIGPDPPELLGTLSLGTALDDALARQLAAASDGEVVLAAAGQVRASSLPAAADARLAPLLGGTPPARLEVDGEDYVALRQPLPGGVVALLLRSRAQRLAVLGSFRSALLGAGLVGLTLALLLSYAVAGTVSRPLAQLSAAVREMTATGDLARGLPRPAGWSDEDAAVLSRSLSALTEAISRLQREAALRERLSALGRLSAVIAHEVRNPLMIIKASLSTLRRPAATREEIGEVADDVAAEVERLGRLVDGVLDYARPPRLEYAAVDLPALCREVVDAIRLGASALRVELDLERCPERLESDPERLRSVLVNLLANAGQAVLERGSQGEGPDVTLRARQRGERVEIVVEDRGVGIPEGQLGQVFEPYFTTRRSGTGLGLAIARNLVEGLGGSIAVQSRQGQGSTFRIDLPLRRPA
jgi:signal transduction histidine kinase